jgi:tetratricopeptide (TPR) repeat protein
MKKFVFAFMLALACIGLVSAPRLRAQDTETISIKDPAEFNAYQIATTQSDPRTKASQLESFLQTYPQSVVKKAVLDMLVDIYGGLNDDDKALSAASRLLQVDPSNMKAIYISVVIKKRQCQRTSDAQTCDDAAALAQKGLTVPKPAGTSGDDWKKLTGATYPIYHSAIALDDAISKKDFKAAQTEYKAELMLYSDDQSKTTGLNDTLLLAQAYSQQGTSQDLVQAVWFYARVWDFAPAAYKGQIEPKLDYYYKKYHGGMDGLDAVKTQAAATTFPPANFVITPAPTPAQLAHQAMSGDLPSLNLEDKEFILANGNKDDADKLWALLKDQVTPVPGIVIEATASVIKVAVTQDAKEAKIADFIVNMKTPLVEKEIPAIGFEYKLAPATELVGTYDTFTQIPATAALAQTAQIVLRDGVVVPEKKKPVPAHKPAAGHKPAAAH